VAAEHLDQSSWPSLAQSLAQQLVRLRDGQFVTLEAPSGAFVQALSLGPGLYLECVGSTSFGGGYPWDAVAEEALAALGWTRETQFGNAVYRADVSIDASAAAAGILVPTLRDVAGVADPAVLTVSMG
jgi:hypothetical protein